METTDGDGTSDPPDKVTRTYLGEIVDESNEVVGLGIGRTVPRSQGNIGNHESEFSGFLFPKGSSISILDLYQRCSIHGSTISLGFKCPSESGIIRVHYRLHWFYGILLYVIGWKLTRHSPSNKQSVRIKKLECQYVIRILLLVTITLHNLSHFLRICMYMIIKTKCQWKFLCFLAWFLIWTILKLLCACI